MSLRRALSSLPDDRETARVVREVVRFLDAHARESVSVDRIVRATGIEGRAVSGVLSELERAHVVDCTGAPDAASCVFAPDSVLEVEVRTFLRSSAFAGSGMQRKVDRFRGRFGSGA